jgi:hypothetical protein
MMSQTPRDAVIHEYVKVLKMPAIGHEYPDLARQARDDCGKSVHFFPAKLSIFCLPSPALNSDGRNRPSYMGVTLILTLDPSSAFAEGNDFPRQRHRPFIRRDQERPGAFKPLTLTQRAKCQNGLPASHPPAHPRTLQALAHSRLTRCFHHPRANGQVLRP